MARRGVGNRRALLTAMGWGVIRLVRRQIARIVAVDAHRVEASVYRSGRQVIARRRDIGKRRPPVGSRVVKLVRRGVAAAPANAADRVDLAIEYGGRQRAARCGESCKSLPTIARWVVFVYVGGWRPALDEAPGDQELAV